MKRHLSLVPPPKPTFSMDAFVVLKIGADIFVCRDGKWEIAADVVTAAEMLVAAMGQTEPPLSWPVCAETAGDGA